MLIELDLIHGLGFFAFGLVGLVVCAIAAAMIVNLYEKGEISFAASIAFVVVFMTGGFISGIACFGGFFEVVEIAVLSMCGVL